MDFYSTSSLKQQSTVSHVTPQGDIILIPNQSSLTLLSCLLSEEASNTNFIAICLTRPGFEPKIYSTGGEQTLAITNAVYQFLSLYCFCVVKFKVTNSGSWFCLSFQLKQCSSHNFSHCLNKICKNLFFLQNVWNEVLTYISMSTVRLQL